MSKRQTNKRRYYKYAIGDMRTMISFFDRKTISKSFSSSIEQRYINEIVSWAAIESVNARHKFTDVNIEKSPITHKFIIRYNSIITSEKVIQHDSEIFKIVKIEDLDWRQEFMIISAHVDGIATKEANK